MNCLVLIFVKVFYQTFQFYEIVKNRNITMIIFNTLTTETHIRFVVQRKY